MKDYKTWDHKPLQLIDWKKGKELHLIFTTKDGRTINTKDLIFNSSYLPNEIVNIENINDFKLKYELFVSEDSTQKIIKTYYFKSDSYEFDVDYELVNSDKFISDSKYQIVWETTQTPLNTEAMKKQVLPKHLHIWGGIKNEGCIRIWSRS